MTGDHSPRREFFLQRTNLILPLEDRGVREQLVFHGERPQRSELQHPQPRQ